MADINRILKKRRCTGKELGILELTNMSELFRQDLAGEERKPVITSEELLERLQGLPEAQRPVYTGYIVIHAWITKEYNIAQAHEQQAQLQYRTLQGFMERAILAEDVYAFLADLPELDAAGRSKQEALYRTLADHSLEAFFPDAPDHAGNVDAVTSSTRALLESCAHLIGYNYALELIGDYYDVPQLTIFGMDNEFIAGRVQELNDLTHTLQLKIDATPESTGKAKKLHALATYFQPIDYDALAIPEKNKQQARALMKDFIAFTNVGEAKLKNLLYTLPRESGKGAN